MAVLYSEPPQGAPLPEPLPHKTWTRDELALVESTGVLEGTHYELIEGELIDKMGKKFPHVRGTFAMAKALRAIFGDDFVITEAPIHVADDDNPRNEPEPDIIVLRQPVPSLTGSPCPQDIVLVVEVAASSLAQDLSTKAKLYARAGIPEYWVLDVDNRRLYLHRDPAAGLYQMLTEIDETGAVEPLAQPGHLIALTGLLPKK